MVRKPIWAGIVICAVLVETGLWMSGTWMLSRHIGRWASQAQMHGWTVTWSGQTWGGWPFAASVTFDKAALGGGARYMPGGFAWSADRVVASISLLRPFTLRMEADGQQFLRLAHAPDIGFIAGNAVAELPLGSHLHGRGSLALADITGGIAGSGHPQDVRLGALSLAWDVEAGEPLATVLLGAEASSIGLPDIGRWPLGATIAKTGATIVLTSPAERGHVDTDDRGAAQAAAWRDGGGTLVVRNATVHWGPLTIGANARLSLDGRLQPAGSGTADASGTAPALDAAAGAGLIAPGLALTAKAALGVMTHVQVPAGDAVRLPFVLRDSTVSVGQIPVARLPDVRW